LDLARQLFVLTLRLHVWIVDYLADPLIYFSFSLAKLRRKLQHTISTTPQPAWSATPTVCPQRHHGLRQRDRGTLKKLFATRKRPSEQGLSAAEAFKKKQQPSNSSSFAWRN
jgi:hypothetical protein